MPLFPDGQIDIQKTKTTREEVFEQEVPSTCPQRSELTPQSKEEAKQALPPSGEVTKLAGGAGCFLFLPFQLPYDLLQFSSMAF